MKSTVPFILSLGLFHSALPMMVKKIKNPFGYNHKEFAYNAEKNLLAAITLHDDELKIINLNSKTSDYSIVSFNKKFAFNRDGLKSISAKTLSNQLKIDIKNIVTNKETRHIDLSDYTLEDSLELLFIYWSADEQYAGIIFRHYWNSKFIFNKINLKTQKITSTKFEMALGISPLISLSKNFDVLAGRLDNHESIGFWKISTGKLLNKITTNGRLISAMTWSPNDRYLLITTQKKPPEGRYLHEKPEKESFQVWDVTTKKCILEKMFFQEGYIECLAFSKEGHLMIISDKYITYWELGINNLKEELLKKLKQKNFTNLTFKLGANKL